MTLKTSINRQLRVPPKFFTKKTTHNQYNYDGDANSQTDLLDNSDEEDSNRVVVHTYCFGFIRRIVPVKFRSIKKIAMISKNKKNKKSQILDQKLSELSRRVETIDFEISEINKEINKNKPTYVFLRDAPSTPDNLTKLSKKKRELAGLLKCRKEKEKKADMINNAISQLLPIASQSESFSDLQLITSAMKAAGQINSSLKTEKMIQEAQRVSDDLADLSMTQGEIDDAILPSNFDDIDITEELDELLGIKQPIDVEELSLPYGPELGRLPDVPSHNHPSIPKKIRNTIAILED